MTERLKPVLGVELITFYEPAFWGLENRKELVEKSESEPRWFWDRVLESVRAAGVGPWAAAQKSRSPENR